MAYMLIGVKRYPVGLVVFDKDGLMFRSQQFWKELGESRLRLMYQILPADMCAKWAKVFGAVEKNGTIEYVDPKGILATAPPKEETAITAGMVVDALGWNWADARALAARIFDSSDSEFDLKRALMPQRGLTEIFEKLKEADIPYAVATSDTTDRVNTSMRMFGLEPPEEELIITPENVKRGKPFPDMLFMLSERTSVPAEKIVMIGDSYVDVQMAREAGAVGIGVPETEEMRERMRPFATEIIESLSEINFEK